MVKWIIISIVGLIILGNLGFDIQKSIKSPVAQSNLEYAKEVVVFIWTRYLSEPVKFLWREVFIKYVIDPLRNGAEKRMEEKLGNTTITKIDSAALIKN